MRTENLVNVIRTTQSMSNAWEMFNVSEESSIKSNLHLNWLAAYTIEFDEVDEELPLYGSYIVAYFADSENAASYKGHIEGMLYKEDYPYEVWSIENQYKNTPYKYIVLVQIGAFLEENI